MFLIAQGALSNQPEDRAGTPLVVTSRGRGADESGMVDLARLLLPGITLAAVIFNWIDVFAKSQVKIILLGFSGGTAMAGGLLLANPEPFAAAVPDSRTLP